MHVQINDEVVGSAALAGFDAGYLQDARTLYTNSRMASI